MKTTPEKTHHNLDFSLRRARQLDALMRVIQEQHDGFSLNHAERDLSTIALDLSAEMRSLPELPGHIAWGLIAKLDAAINSVQMTKEQVLANEQNEPQRIALLAQMNWLESIAGDYAFDLVKELETLQAGEAWRAQA